MWSTILKKAPFLFEISTFFTKSVKFWTIFEKEKAPFFFLDVFRSPIVQKKLTYTLQWAGPSKKLTMRENFFL